MWRVSRLIFVSCACIGFAVALSSGRSSSDPVDFDQLINEYSDYLDGLSNSSQINAEQALHWTNLFESALQTWQEYNKRQAAWNVIFTLHNAREEWSASLSACESALAEATAENNDQDLFNWQYDRWTILQRIDPGQRVADPQIRIVAARSDAMGTFERMMDGNGFAMKSAPWIKYVALAWPAVHEPAYKDRVAVLKRLITLSQAPQFSRVLHDETAMNYRGYLAGILVGNDPDAAAKSILDAKATPKLSALALTLAIESASEEGAKDLQVNKMIWSTHDAFANDDADWLNICIRHVNQVIDHAQQAKKAQLETGDGAKALAGVPTEDLINLLEPSVDDMLSAGYNRIPAFQDSQEFKDGFSILQNAMGSLGNILELHGEHDIAQSYLTKTSPDKQAYPLHRP